MDKEFVAYALALRMKLIGFDEPCLAWFVSESYGLELGNVVKSDLIKDAVLAPLFQQAFRWFREKYGAGHISKLVEIFDSNDCTYEEAEVMCLQRLIEAVEQKQG
jgi:hypothetical protein